ncbi:BlaI/MecI/CopY family transcriptional regulator [Catenulispora sp. NF23]|uniref:BlaI/MecI/CopY family transcriptional regulator n=1 Tax=Catenulispora pinistramenti TaxID=2705254 RepID=A0ABS5KSP3_9ACTN|nr:BlaI/MecI/CopY family transcriptional regulator [Catenulispora pinistramenti]MBS2539316.1 BlaI/MecI/CopY family transcriptional regulator [Catenulispora pinistramenti]MBS2549025.1 BlaI/MecI/CopY family transcriptional regulator [Catenulispora pinistramenti]
MALRQFGELEAQVMDRVWRHNRPVLVRDILYDVNTDRKLAYTTVLTVMERLCRKGWLRRQRQGRAHAYEAVASREHYTAQLMCDALATSSNQTVSFVHFLEQLSTEENQALRAALEVRQLLSDDATDEGG